MSLKRYELIPDEYLQKLFQDDELKATLKENFDTLDDNKDGRLTLEELARLLIICKIDSHFAPLVIKLCDVDHDGTITLDEFANFSILCGKLKNDPSILYRNMFDLFDNDSSGYLDGDEIKDFIQYFVEGELPDAKYKKLLKAVDTDNDGKLSFEEVCRFLDIITEQ